MTLILCVVKRSATYNAKSVYRLVIARTYAAPQWNWRNELTSNITLRIDVSQRVYLTDNCISYGGQQTTPESPNSRTLILLSPILGARHFSASTLDPSSHRSPSRMSLTVAKFARHLNACFTVRTSASDKLDFTPYKCAYFYHFIRPQRRTQSIASAYCYRRKWSV